MNNFALLNCRKEESRKIQKKTDIFNFSFVSVQNWLAPKPESKNTLAEFTRRNTPIVLIACFRTKMLYKHLMSLDMVGIIVLHIPWLCTVQTFQNSLDKTCYLEYLRDAKPQFDHFAFPLLFEMIKRFTQRCKLSSGLLQTHN